MNPIVKNLFVSVAALVLAGCAVPPDAADANGGGGGTASPPDGGLKPYPHGVMDTASFVRRPNDDVVRAAPDGGAGALVALPWNLCDAGCLFETIQTNLITARQRGKVVGLAVADGLSVPDEVKAECQTVDYRFRDAGATMCVAWDPNYLQAKKAFVRELGARFDGDEALAYVYFTGPCSTNGNEGHCRIDQAAYVAAGYTAEKMTAAYLEVMDAYVQAFPRTPIVFEVHTIFDSAQLWEQVWQHIEATRRVGIAAWWCAERLSVSGRETAPVWPLLQRAAETSFTVCQTVGSFTRDPWRFSDSTLGLNYGTESNFTPSDSLSAFTDTMDWAEGRAVHAGQTSNIRRFNVYEAWYQDGRNPAFQPRLNAF